MDNQFSQEKLDRFISSSLDEIVLFQKLAKRKSSFEETAFNPDLRKLNYPSILFKYSLLDRIIVIFISVVIMFLSIIFYVEKGNVAALIVGFAVAFILSIAFWLLADKTELELSASGVTYKSVAYNWDDIEKTMIWSQALFTGKRHSKKFAYYLVLAMKNGEILPLEISHLYLKDEKGTEISRLLLREHQLISHFVEYFKAKRMTAKS